MVNVRFDESNGSQKEHMPNVIDESLISDAIQQMAIGSAKPVEGSVPKSSDDDAPMTQSRTRQSTAKANAPPNGNGNQNPNADQNGNPEGNDDTNADADDNDHHEENAHPRVENRVDPSLILNETENPEPTKYEEAMNDPDWMNAMQEELVQFELNDVWELVNKPNPEKHNINGFSTISKVKMEKYLKECLKKFKMQDSKMKGYKTPMPTNGKLDADVYGKDYD
nr:circumsporozoite protein-like [Aegilops tauschii subsp. strangulata]